jgi:predicted esterase YcpF (UPF0227 family)
MILHIHGYAQNHNNLAFRILSREIKESDVRAVIMPFIDYQRTSPGRIADALFETFQTRSIPSDFDGLVSAGHNNKIELVIGYSLGGFFAYCLKSVLDAPVLLINPCLAPFVYLYKWTNGDFSREYERGYAELFCRYVRKADTTRMRAVIGERDDYIDHGFTRRILPPESVDTVDSDHNLSLAPACIRMLEDAIFDMIGQSFGGATP